jgi:hypothetical protein
VKRGIRGLAFIAIVLAHVALVALLMRPLRQNTTEQVELPRMTVVFIDPDASRVTNESLPFSTPLPPLPAPLITPIEPSSAITVAPEVSPETSPPSVDWQKETQTAAARTAEGLATQGQRKGKYAPDPRFARPAPRPKFGWDESKTHRIEILPDGAGTLIHLNDRCALVLSAGFFPVCKLGKIAARGDLFEHMGDRPADDDPP